MYYPGRNLLDTRSHLRRGFYGGESHVPGDFFSEVNINGCWLKALGEMNSWISRDLIHNADGLGGDLENLTGIENWTSSEIDCLDINDMNYIEDEEQVPAPDFDEDSDDEDSDGDDYDDECEL